MPDPVTARPKICLNMIARNEAHVVRELLDSVAPYISSWVIAMDTRSDDGTTELIRQHMAGLGIPGEIYERPWRNFGYNRTEALNLAQGHGDYIWVMDADDQLIGTPDFTELSADVYWLRCQGSSGNSCVFWRPQLFRAGVPVRYEGVVHEYATWDAGYVDARLEGDYHIEHRHIGTRSLNPQKYEHDRDLLLAEVERNPADARSAFYLAQTYFTLGDFANAHKWYSRRAEMGGWDEEAYCAMLRIAELTAQLGSPGHDVQHAYLRAWEFRPTRAEPLYDIAQRYRIDQRYQLGYLFAERAAAMPVPEGDIMRVRADVYDWRAADEQAVCASWIGKQPEAFTLWRRILARPDIPDEDRERIAANRDVCVPTMLDAASSYPETVVRSLVEHRSAAEVVISLIAGPDLARTEQTLNSFLHCCTDVSRVGRFLVLDAGLPAEDRAALAARYPFLEFIDADSTGQKDAQLATIRAQIDTRFWLHLGEGWRFFAPENLITRLTAVLQAEPEVFQVAVNVTDAAELTGVSAAESAVRRAPDAGRYLLTDPVANGPAMVDTARGDRASRTPSSRLQTASLDEVLCITSV